MPRFIVVFYLFYFSAVSYGQALYIDSTRFITGNECCTVIYNSIPTHDEGMLFVGSQSRNPLGIIPNFPLDTTFENVFIGKIDNTRQISWIKVYGGSSDDGAGPSCQTPDGGFAVLGGTASNDGNVSHLIGASDFWLLRTDGLGNLLWEKTYGSTASDGAASIANTPDHGFIMAGTTTGSDGDVPFHYGSMFALDWLVIKTDSIGNVQWSKDIGGTRDELEHVTVLSVNNNYYLVGSSSSTDHDCTDTGWHIGANTKYDYYLLKLDDTGKVLWSKSYGGSGSDAAIHAIFDERDSTIVITGTSTSANYMVTDSHGQEDIWVIKVDRNGVLIWQKTLGTPQQEGGTGICKSIDGGYVVCGATYPGPIMGEDCWLSSLDVSGNEKVSKIFGGTDNDISYSIIPFANNYVISGGSGSKIFTEGSCNTNYSGAFVTYLDYWPLSVSGASANQKLVHVYPNPAQSKIKVNLPTNSAHEITISDIYGRVMFKQVLGQYTQLEAINVVEWPTGMYLLKMQYNDGSTSTTQFVKN